MDKLRKRRLIENEVIFREANRSVQEFMEEHGSPRRVLNFYCECSDPDCRARIKLSSDEYQELHRNKRQFVVTQGHYIPPIEKVIREYKDFAVVEKYDDPPSASQISTALKAIST